MNFNPLLHLSIACISFNTKQIPKAPGSSNNMLGPSPVVSKWSLAPFTSILCDRIPLKNIMFMAIQIFLRKKNRLNSKVSNDNHISLSFFYNKIICLYVDMQKTGIHQPIWLL